MQQNHEIPLFGLVTSPLFSPLLSSSPVFFFFLSYDLQLPFQLLKLSIQKAYFRHVVSLSITRRRYSLSPTRIQTNPASLLWLVQSPPTPLFSDWSVIYPSMRSSDLTEWACSAGLSQWTVCDSPENAGRMKKECSWWKSHGKKKKRVIWRLAYPDFLGIK